MRIVCLALLIVGCGVYEEESEVGFIGYSQTGESPYMGFLITKVHRPFWKIGYYFGNRCTPHNKSHFQNIENDITKMLSTWLDHLRNKPYLKGDIVNEFRFLKIQEEAQGKTLDLVIKFACDLGRSAAFHGSGDENKLFFPPKILMQKSTFLSPLRPNNLDYDFDTLLHELGHAIGLQDTYSRDNWGVNGTNDKYFRDTIGNQPPSVMSGHHFDRNDDDSPPLLSEDDKKGLEWIYLNYFRPNKVKGISDCYFPNYELEWFDSKSGHRGCAPRNPVIFMLKNGYVNHIRYYIRHGDRIKELFNKREHSGRRLYPLHYAAMIPNNRGSVLFFDDYIKIVKNINSSDNRGQTPLHYAVRAGNEQVAYGLIGNPKIDLSKKLPNKMTYLHFAVQFSEVEMFCWLYYYGRAVRDRDNGLFIRHLDETLKDRWGLTPLERAHTRLAYWKRRKNNDMVQKTRQIISMLSGEKTGYSCVDPRREHQQ